MAKAPGHDRIFREPETYHQRPVLRRNITRVLKALQKSGLWSSTVVVEGLEHLHNLAGPAIIAPNHRHWADIPFDGVLLDDATEQPVTFSAKRELWKYYLGAKFIEALGGVPVDRDSRSLEHFLILGRYTVERGGLFVVYPEGTRSLTEEIQIKVGPAYLSLVSGVPIIPIGQYGTEDMLNPFKRLPVVAVVGEPIYPDETIAIEGEAAGWSQRRIELRMVRELNNRLAAGMQNAFDVAKEHYQDLGGIN